MLSEGLYTISELKRILEESTDEFKPRIDSKVIKDDAQNNVKAVNDIMKETGAMENKATSKGRNTNPENTQDYNKTTLDVNFEDQPSKEYSERVKAQVHGFASKEHEENAKTDESADFSVNKEFYDEQSKKSKERNEDETEFRHAGLKSHNLDKDNFKNKTIYTNESKKMKKLHFKNTVFLSEAQVTKKIPDDYKTDGNKFLMEDKNHNVYLVECQIDDNIKGFTKIKLTKKDTKEQIEEQIRRMQELSGYKSSDYFKDTTVQSRMDESKNLSVMLNTVKELKTTGNKK